jgi:Protein of unknown function (DUF3592)
MSVPIPIGSDYTATASGSTFKAVQCENCQEEYIYFMHRTSMGTGTSLLFLDNEGARERSESRARKHLERSLKNSVDPVPCPKCGWYQPDMVKALRQRYRLWMDVVGVVLFVAFVIFSVAAWGTYMKNAANLPSWFSFVVAIGLMAGVGSAGLFGLRRRQAARLDPNETDLDERLRAGRIRAVTRTEVEKQIQEGTADLLRQIAETEQNRLSQQRRQAERSGSRFRRIMLLLCGLAILGFSIWLTSTGLRKVQLGKESLSWPSVKGSIVHSYLRKHGEQNRVSYTAEIRYRYKVNGSDYVSDQLWYGAGQGAAGNVQVYPLRKEVTVYYQPDDPPESVLVPGAFGGAYFVLAAGIATAIAGSACLVYIVILRRRMISERGDDLPPGYVRDVTD